MRRKSRCSVHSQRAAVATTSDASHHVTVVADTSVNTAWLISVVTTKMAFRPRSLKSNTTRTVLPTLHCCTMSMELSATSWHLLVCSKVTWWSLAQTPTSNQATTCHSAICHWVQ